MASQEPLANTSAGNRYDGLTPEQIEQEMEKTRESLAVKLSRLEDEVEDKVRTTVDHVSGQIVETVDHITGKVRHSVDKVHNTVDKVHDKLSFRSRVEKDPYKTLAGVLVAGLAFGAWIGYRSRPKLGLQQRPASQPLLTQKQRQRAGALVKGALGSLAMTAGRQFMHSKVNDLVHKFHASGRA
jgi:hypothetical protein